MKYVCVKKSNMRVVEVKSEAPNFKAFGSVIRSLFYFFAEPDEILVSPGQVCTIESEGIRTYEPA